jgi:hypothetical protein
LPLSQRKTISLKTYPCFLKNNSLMMLYAILNSALNIIFEL